MESVALQRPAQWLEDAPGRQARLALRADLADFAAIRADFLKAKAERTAAKAAAKVAAKVGDKADEKADENVGNEADEKADEKVDVTVDAAAAAERVEL